ncbi:hypothetical protein BSIN_3974 [Burkholderia singularis]|uniref:Uncharacterized protein n=1 Tax=Burkholderia singularis TaxID=1503053 RepID=A0A238H6J8_9BURK|nr:hypothetical protein BSIN_3974 [Burkholderia singularis]
MRQHCAHIRVWIWHVAILRLNRQNHQKTNHSSMTRLIS